MSNEKFVLLANNEIEAEYMSDDIVPETQSLNGWSIIENIGIGVWNPDAFTKVIRV